MERIELSASPEMAYVQEEAFRTLRTNIQFCGDDIKAIMISSFAPNEGKTTVSFGLARSMAEAGNKVLFIDTDMRKSVLAARMRAKSLTGNPISGLSHFCSGQKKAGNVFCSVENIPNLNIIFAGPSVPNPTEILDNKYFKELMKFAKENYDKVIVDCAPIGLVIDAAVVAKHCDGAIMVVAQGTSNRRHIAAAKTQLEASGVRMLGAVLNKADTTKNGYYGYGTYGAYGAYGAYGSYGNETDK